MSYEGEFAGYRSLKRIADALPVRLLVSRCQLLSTTESPILVVPEILPDASYSQLDYVVAIDGSHHEVPAKTGYPGAKIGYLTVASVLLDLQEVERLDKSRPVDPNAFRQTEETATIDAALPGSNVVTRTHRNAKTSFREEVYEVLHRTVVDSQERVPLLETYEALLRLKPDARVPSCPYSEYGCEESFEITGGLSCCPCNHRRAIWSTDALRVHEGFRDVGENGECLGEVMQVLERLLLVHLLRAFEIRGLLDKLNNMAFILDGPLAVFGHPAWLSSAILRELQRINEKVRGATGVDILILGVEKTGQFVSHFNEIDQPDAEGIEIFPPRGVFIPTDSYIKQRIIFSDSPKRYGKDTYFGRKCFYKTASGARIVATIPFLSPEQETLESGETSLYPGLPRACKLLDKVVSCRYPNSLAPLIAAHAQAAIPLEIGSKVLEQLTKALMRKS